MLTCNFFYSFWIIKIVCLIYVSFFVKILLDIFSIAVIATQVRIAEADNTAQYGFNLSSQQSAIVIGPCLTPHFGSTRCIQWT